MNDKTLIKKMRVIARRFDWTLAMHGSMKRDIDLVAIPWTDKAAPWLKLYKAWIKELNLWDTEGPIKLAFRPARAHGRRSLIILRPGAEPVGKHPKGKWKPKALDVSFMPRIT